MRQRPGAPATGAGRVRSYRRGFFSGDDLPRPEPVGQTESNRRPDRLIEEDFRHLELRQTFPLIILPFNTFSHLTEPAEAHSALKTIAAQLAPAGVFALALPNPIPIYSAVPEGLVLERTFRDEERKTTVQQFSSLRVDRVGQLGHITWIYDEIDPIGKVTRTTVPMTLRYFFPDEIPLLLERAGLRLLHLWGDYDRSQFAEDLPALIVVGGSAG